MANGNNNGFAAPPSGNVTQDIVAKIWNLFNILKDDGVTYHQYVTELTYLLFLKMAKETGSEKRLPAGCRWDDLEHHNATDRVNEYKQMLIDLGRAKDPLVQQIYRNASTIIQKPATLTTLIEALDKIDWFSAKREGLGDLYEGLLEKNAGEKKSGAGQYFTPRELIESMVAVMKPTLDDIIQDPAAGTGGFLIRAGQFIRNLPPFAPNDSFDRLPTWTAKQQKKFHNGTFFGLEHVQDAQRLALMNLMLHDLETDPNVSGIFFGDTLSDEGAKKLPPSTLILSNPPFGTKKGGGLPSRSDFTFLTSNKQLCFLEHIYRGLKPGGRAAVVLPDNVLFEGNIGRLIRADLMEKANLHTILRLPTGIFYAQGVKTNVLFFTLAGPRQRDKGNTKEVWVYDLRANMPTFGKRTILTREYFAGFEAAFGDDPNGGPAALAARVDEGEMGRFRKFTREWIAERGDSLDIAWLKDDSDAPDEDGLTEPDALAQFALGELEGAIEELRGILAELGAEEIL